MFRPSDKARAEKGQQGGLGGVTIPSHVFILGNIPHDWLFGEGRVTAVVHHGGAGTTAIGLSKGLPTVVVPFFGDQAFWGEIPVFTFCNSQYPSCRYDDT